MNRLYKLAGNKFNRNIEDLISNRRLFVSFCFFLFLVLSAPGNAFATIYSATLASNNSTVPAASACIGRVKVPFYSFSIQINSGSGGADATPVLSTITYTTTGTYTSSDIATGYKLFYSTTNTFSTATTQLGTTLSVAGPGTLTFSSLALTMAPGTYYFWITTDINSAATPGRTFTNTNSLPTSNMVFSTTLTSGSSGTSGAGNTQTINAVPAAVSITPGTSSTICFGNAAAFTAGISPTVNILNQNFNSGLTGSVGGTWSVVNSGGASAYNWGIFSSTAFSGITGDGTSMAGTSGDMAGSILLITQLRSPSFSTVGLTGASLTFNYFCQSDNVYDDIAEIGYSTNGGSSWTVLHNYLNTTTGTVTWSAATPTQTISLPSGALGQPNVMLRWYYRTNWGWYWVVDNVKLTGTYSTPAYVWSGISGASGLSCTSCATTTITPTVLGANIYSVTATSNGCSSTNGVTLTTEEAGAVTVSGGGAYCGSAVLTASGGTGGTIYYQSTTSVGTSTATPSTTQTVTATGTYYFRSRTSAASCWGTQGSATVTINPTPSSTGATNSGPICVGGTVTLSANSSNATAWSWTGPGGFTSTLQNPTATPTITGTYSLTVSTSGSGCSPSTVYATTVTVNPVP
ncbi:MAG: hypothetical protein K9G49_15595, partial [Taibaiella sp.]|nr:hypothetical protein [Taibaiella sp.]